MTNADKGEKPNVSNQVAISNDNVKVPEILNSWASAVSNLDADEVIEHYSEAASLKGTMYDNRLFGKQNCKTYFSDEFLKGKSSLSCTFNSVNKVGGEPSVLEQFNGEYTFDVETIAGEKSDVKAHFEFSLVPNPKKEGEQLIASHGSYFINSTPK